MKQNSQLEQFLQNLEDDQILKGRQTFLLPNPEVLVFGAGRNGGGCSNNISDCMKSVNGGNCTNSGDVCAGSTNKGSCNNEKTVVTLT